MGVSWVNGPARHVAPDEPELFVTYSRRSIASLLLASHTKGKIPLERLWLLGSSSWVTTWGEISHLEELC